jgi:arginine/lysine/ornithine decarboxylase
MHKKKQDRAPIIEALENFKNERVVPFDVPGHKRGKGNSELLDFFGEKCVGTDVNSQKPLDSLCHPVSIIKEAEELMADAFGAHHAFLIVNGTSSAVTSMILTACKPGDKIILPRNIHRSAINAIILCGAIPVYVNPQINQKIGISLGMSLTDFNKAVAENPDAKAVFVNNPTYYGICSDIKSIVELAHQHNMLVLADEAHGTQFYFHDELPISAMAAGADMAAVSMHKSGGSLTQSSILLVGKHMNKNYVRQIINLTQTTSGSYLLMGSLDISRRNLALRGRQIFSRVIEMTEYAREEINHIGDYYAYSRELANNDSVFDFDITKLSVNTLNLGLAGIEVFDILREEYGIQAEFGDLGNILAYVSVGDRYREIERLVGALAEIRRLYKRPKLNTVHHEYINPKVVLPPQKAFYAPKKAIPIEQSAGYVSTEFVMSYPPGIPVLSPGELITKDIIEYIRYSKEKGCFLIGTMDEGVNTINVTEV